MAISSKLFPLLLLLSLGSIASAAVFTINNQCIYTVWPGIFSQNGLNLGGGGFSLASGQSVQLTVQPGWSGRLWARTRCNFSSSGNGRCITGDCRGSLRCALSGEPPATLAEFTLSTDPRDGIDFYDVSLVDGYNVGMLIVPIGGTGDCQYAGCTADLNGDCPKELQVTDSNSGSVVACKSACTAFNTPEFCCTGNHSMPETCTPTHYSRVFKNACPNAYSYAYDDASSIHTCSGSNYVITFCPTGSNH
ncbi:pathogenesis-related thaumatin-like protein 3.5 [Corylus avellana]|uniref:pathogenesis-related thaumatin-like protein 3.5 n=1 Tax=Corylus avellana TaxID=13451 RepID=UPI001E20604D|nr:pathogenesis-related thaumatin-like protein 3.5 [Corylus avellana]